jgi:hypothetical protein
MRGVRVPSQMRSHVRFCGRSPTSSMATATLDFRIESLQDSNDLGSEAATATRHRSSRELAGQQISFGTGVTLHECATGNLDARPGRTSVRTCALSSMGNLARPLGASQPRRPRVDGMSRATTLPSRLGLPPYRSTRPSAARSTRDDGDLIRSVGS